MNTSVIKPQPVSTTRSALKKTPANFCVSRSFARDHSDFPASARRNVSGKFFRQSARTVGKNSFGSAPKRNHCFPPRNGAVLTPGQCRRIVAASRVRTVNPAPGQIERKRWSATCNIATSPRLAQSVVPGMTKIRCGVAVDCSVAEKLIRSFDYQPSRRQVKRRCASTIFANVYARAFVGIRLE